MPVTQKIQQCLEQLPEPMQSEVLHFAEFLASRLADEDPTCEDRQWSEISLALAMRGMEDEDDTSYSVTDLKESFS